jgi:flagellar hook assembly protein FlgD
MFGLGDAMQVDSLRVHWPSGLMEVHRDVPVDGLIVLAEGDTVTGSVRSDGAAYGQLRAAPNPARGHTSFHWAAPGTPASLRVRDVRGRVVRTLAGSTPRAGAVVWDGRTDSGDRVPAGVYFVSLETSAGNATTRVTLLR